MSMSSLEQHRPFKGGWVMLVPVVLTDIFGHDTIGKAFGLNRCAEGLSALAGPAFVGWIFHHSGSYTIAFLLAGAEFVADGLALLVPGVLNKLEVVETATVKLQKTEHELVIKR